MPKLGFLINLELCSDQRNCMIACKRQKDTAPGVNYIETYTSVDDAFPKNTTYFIPIMCQHCENPSCLVTCPHHAIAKLDNGAVIIADPTACETCKDKPCVEACPYDAMKLDPKTGTVGKCDMCLDLLSQGKPPACIPNCYCMAIAFGDMEDPASPYNQVLGMVDQMGIPREVALHKLCPETGNNPSVTYILASKPWRDMNGLKSAAWKNPED